MTNPNLADPGSGNPQRPSPVPKAAVSVSPVDGGVVVGNATGGSEGPGTLNAVELFQDGTPVGGGGGGINQLTGDVLAGPGAGSQVATLETVNPDVGSFTNANITVDGKGRVTAATNGGGGYALNAAVTPFAGGGQVGAIQLSAGITPINAPASSNDSLALPDAIAGTVCILIPLPAAGGAPNTNSPGLWPKDGSTDTINSVDAGVDFFNFPELVGNNSVIIPVWAICVVNGNWLVNAYAN